MLRLVLILGMVWEIFGVLYLLYRVASGHRTVLRWTWRDLWMLLPYGAFIWALIAVLNGARP